MLLLLPSHVHAAVNTPTEPTGARVARFPVAGSLPRSMGGSASALNFSRPAQRSLHVAACTLAEPPMAALLSGVLQSISFPPRTAPVASGWSNSCRTGFEPARNQRLSTAHHRPWSNTSRVLLSSTFFSYTGGLAPGLPSPAHEMARERRRHSLGRQAPGM